MCCYKIRYDFGDKKAIAHNPDSDQSLNLEGQEEVIQDTIIIEE